jgi:phage tail-like protein
MALTTRPKGPPFGAFNFQITCKIGNNHPADPQAGFQEISGIGLEVTEAEYRVGNYPENHVRKVSGLHKVTDVTLKRGVIGTPDIFAWIDEVRKGNVGAANNDSTVTIALMDETGQNQVMYWTLAGAKPKSYKGVTLNAKGGTEVAIEELVLSCERIDLNLQHSG